MGARTALHVEELYRQYSQRVYGFVYRQTTDAQLAQQITNDVFRIVLQHQKEPSEDVLPWLLVTARTWSQMYSGPRAADAASSRSSVAPNWPAAPEPEDYPGSAVRDVLTTLHPQEREILMLAYWDLLSILEISSILECSPDSAKSRLFRARRAFSQKAPNQMVKDGNSDGQH